VSEQTLLAIEHIVEKPQFNSLIYRLTGVAIKAESFDRSEVV
jgi:hypothetical protein